MSNLQAKNITVQEATCGADLLIARMKSLRTEEKFGMFFDEVEKKSYNLTEEPALPRFRKIPRRDNDGSMPHHYQTQKDQYMHIYFEVLEVIVGEIERRFDQPDLKTIKDVEQLMLVTMRNLMSMTKF